MLLITALGDNALPPGGFALLPAELLASLPAALRADLAERAAANAATDEAKRREFFTGVMREMNPFRRGSSQEALAALTAALGGGK